MCRGGKSLTHSLWPIWCVIIALSLLSSCGTLGEKKHLNLMERQEVEKQRAMWVQEGTRQFRKLHSENKPLFTLLFLWAIPASGHRLPSWREPAEKKGNKIGELQSILSFFWCVYARLGDYFSVWEPMGAAARGTDLMSLPECFRAWQKKKEREREREKPSEHARYQIVSSTQDIDGVHMYAGVVYIHPAVCTYNMIPSHPPMLCLFTLLTETWVVMWPLRK